MGVPTKWLKFFWLKIFWICRRCHWHRWQICHRCRWYRWSTLSCEYLREFSKKLETALMLYSGAWGKLIHEKNQKQKISWHCPFKGPGSFNQNFIRRECRWSRPIDWYYSWPPSPWSFYRTFNSYKWAIARVPQYLLFFFFLLPFCSWIVMQICLIYEWSIKLR